MRFKFLCFIALLSACQAVEKQYISLLVPPAIFSNKPYSAYLATSNFQSDTDIIISLRKEVGFYKIRKGQTTKQTQIVTFDKAGIRSFVDRGTQFGDQVGFPLKFLVRQNNKCIDKEVIILNTPWEDHIFIQLDKPYYKPNDEVKYRVYVLDHDTKPVTISTIFVEIRDNEGNVVEQNKELSDQEYKSEGLFESTFKLSDNINLGNWTITAQINGNSRKVAEKKFQVGKATLPFFEVIIDVKDDIYLDDKTVDLVIFGKYAFGEYINGMASIKITNNATGIVMYEDNFKVEAKLLKKIHIKNDLEIRMMPLGQLNLTITVKLNDKVIGENQSAQKHITLHSSRKNSIEIRKFYPYQEGFKYEFSVVVFDPNGKRIPSSNDPVELKYSIKLNNGTQIDNGHHANLKKGLARFEISAYNNVNELKLNVKYKSTEVEEIITADLTITGALRVSVKPKLITNENQDIELTVEYKELYDIVVLAIGRTGIAYSKNHNCLGDTVCKLNLNGIKKNYENLKPEAKIVVYSIEHYDKQIVYGSALFQFEGFSENEVSIKIPNRAEPKETVKIEFKSKKDSIVSILGIDKKLTFLANGHDVTREDVINALTNTKKLAYAKNEKEDVIFDRANNNFIVNLPLNKWRDCSQSETDLVSKMDDPRNVGRTAHGGLYFPNEEEDDFELIEQEIDTTIPKELDVRENFPETWIWDSYKLTDDDSESFEKIVPDSMTTWLFTGISIHKDYGLAIARPQELIASQEFFIELNLPYSIKFGEIFQLEVIAFNYVQGAYAGDIEAKITVIAQHGNAKQQFKFIKFVNIATNCRTEDIPTTTLTENLNIPTESGLSKKFLIKPLINEKIKIRVEAEAIVKGKKKPLTDKIVKELVVENEGVAYYDENNYEFRLNPGKPQDYFTHIFNASNVREGSIDLTAVIAGDMMGPALNFYNGLFILPNGCGEQTMARYGRTLWLYIYLKSTGKITVDQERQAKGNLNSGYQNMMRFKKSDGGFHVWGDTNSAVQGSTWMAAYTSRLLGSAMQFGIEPISPDVIRNALNFCVRHQNSDGSFIETPYSKAPSSPEESKASRKVRFTAFVLLALLKNKDFVGVPYTTEIEKAFHYIENHHSYDNYGAAVAVYAAVMAKRISTIKNLFESLEKVSETDGVIRYWDIREKTHTSQDTQVLISAYTAMAYIENGQLNKAEPIIRWLMKVRNPQGGFGDSHSTAVAMEALAKMASKTGASDTKIHFEFLTNSSQEIKYELNNTNALKPHLIKMPKSTLQVGIKGQGKGYGVVTSYYEYYKIVQDVSDTFDLFVTPSFDATGSQIVEACVKRKKVKLNSDMVIMEFNLVSGYVYEPRSKPMKNNNYIKNVEIRRGGTLVDLYFEEVPFGSPQCVKIFVKKGFEIYETKKASVKVYEYDQRVETFSSNFYNLGKVGC